MSMEAVLTKMVKKSVCETLKPEWNPRSLEDKALLNEFIQTRPKNVPLTDEEIQEEVNMVRYGNKYGKSGRNWEEDLNKIEEIKKRICLK